ncbi:5,10-methylenetetrahydromethanopterin reductase [Pseudonocardia sulfidoxydans NBRC 16205]|uniref:5,10-methylenetetrahydromethanopterin reductase n=1 Tax=Pseudonocardia sulfidoxydans NBRC 16205 TaxID=1223511 RepID=A0A511DGT2_9PSEU|nr:LLM class flavin-dependent oxidoreductase [Pseudonocardia sulfidoxydans]GEL23727.1 5,10-methylenetetrahydromethanopterin reductase [Pseudonocardia sulfidoxydans NBRC 16205]
MPRLAASFVFASTPLAVQVDLVRTLEAGGVDHVFFGEAWREPVVPMTAALLGSSTIGVGSAISQIYPVNPVVVAQQAAQLAELGPGRFSLGLGLGASFVVERWFGVPYDRPLRRAREFADIVRGVLASPEAGPFTYSGEIFSVKRYQLPFADAAVRVPVHLAAVGPAMQTLAGEVADGVVVGALHSERTMEQTVARLERGAARRGRTLEDLTIWYYLACCVSTDSDRARAMARRSLVYLTQYPHYRAVYSEEGFATEADTIAGLVRQKEMDRAERVVTDEMIDRFAIAGTVAECRDQLNRYAAYPGVPVLHLIPFRMDEAEVQESFRLAANLAR